MNKQPMNCDAQLALGEFFMVKYQKKILGVNIRGNVCARLCSGQDDNFSGGLIFQGEMSGDVWEELFGVGAPFRITHIGV